MANIAISKGIGVIYVDGDYSEDEKTEIIDEFIKLSNKKYGPSNDFRYSPQFIIDRDKEISVDYILRKEKDYKNILDELKIKDHVTGVHVRMLSKWSLDGYWTQYYGYNFELDGMEANIIYDDPRFKDIRFIMNVAEVDEFSYSIYDVMMLDFNVSEEGTLNLIYKENIDGQGMPMMSYTLVEDWYTQRMEKIPNVAFSTLDIFEIMSLLKSYINLKS